MFNNTELKDALQFAVKATAKNDNRPVLTGVYLDFSDTGKCSIVGTDGYRMHYTTIAYTGPEVPSLILDGKDAKKLATELKKSGSTRVIVSYNADTRVTQFEQYYKGDQVWQCATVQGKYPRWAMVLPPPDRPHYAIYLDHETVTMIYNVFESFGTVLLSNGKAYTRENKDYHTSMTVPCAVPDDYTMCFNPQYLMDALHTRTSLSLHVDSRSPLAPYMVYLTNTQHALIMPCSQTN